MDRWQHAAVRKNPVDRVVRKRAGAYQRVHRLFYKGAVQEEEHLDALQQLARRRRQRHQWPWRGAAAAR